MAFAAPAASLLNGQDVVCQSRCRVLGSCARYASWSQSGSAACSHSLCRHGDDVGPRERKEVRVGERTHGVVGLVVGEHQLCADDLAAHDDAALRVQWTPGLSVQETAGARVGHPPQTGWLRRWGGGSEGRAHPAPHNPALNDVHLVCVVLRIRTTQRIGAIGASASTTSEQTRNMGTWTWCEGGEGYGVPMGSHWRV